MHKNDLRRRCALMGLAALVAGAAQGSAAAQAGSSDVTGPVLTKFDAAKVFDVSRPAPAMVVDFKVRDDLSGVSWGYALALGADDVAVYVSWSDGFPKKVVTGQMSSRADYAHAYLKPGTYFFLVADFWDDAGNLRHYEAGELAALGNATFTVVNTTGYDSLKPSLVDGEVLTPRVSLSHPRQVGVRVHAADTGDSAVSGVASIDVVFCTLDSSACISGSNRNRHAPGQAEWDATLGIELYAGPGVYHLRSIHIEDHAGNGWGGLSVLFEDGWIDFDQYFPSTTITVTP